MMCFVGAYTSGNSVFDVLCVMFFGIIAILCNRRVFRGRRSFWVSFLAQLSKRICSARCRAFDGLYAIFHTANLHCILSGNGFSLAYSIRKNIRDSKKANKAVKS